MNLLWVLSHSVVFWESTMKIDNGAYQITNANGMRTTVTIPEPATVTLSLLAFCGLAARRRR